MTALTEPQAIAVARGIAADNGLTLDAEALAAAVARLTADLGLDENLSLAFEIATPFNVKHGQVVDVQPFDHALSVIRAHGKPIERKPSAPGAAFDAPTRPKPGAPVSDFGKAFAAQHDAAMIRVTEKMPNPWLPGQTNRTNQTIITNKNPALAVRYKAEARV